MFEWLALPSWVLSWRLSLPVTSTQQRPHRGEEGPRHRNTLHRMCSTQQSCPTWRGIKSPGLCCPFLSTSSPRAKKLRIQSPHSRTTFLFYCGSTDIVIKDTTCSLMCISMRRSCWVHPLQYLAFQNMEIQQNKWARGESLEKFEIRRQNWWTLWDN